MKKHVLILSILTLIYITVLSVFLVRNHLTYLETSAVNLDHDTYIIINSPNDELIQDFVMPYDIIQGISVQIGTFARDNNSEWNISLTDPSGRVYFSRHFNASLLQDNGFYYAETDRNIRLEKNSRYQVRISASKASFDSALAFYVSRKAKNSLLLTKGGQSYDGTLCFKILGGDPDPWWSGFVVFLSLIAFLLILRINCVLRINIRWFQDDIVQASLVGVVSFLLLFSFCTTYQFTDETDNILGGITIANGGVLYRDYVTQHTPFVYYLCSIFALLGAKSPEQFRLSYYLLVSAVWGLLYLRHKRQFGMKVLMLPIAESIIINSMAQSLSRAGCMVLSDNVQGMCFVVLILEFFKYCEDKTLNWDRAAIVSICTICSIGSAFVSAFTLIWFALAFVAAEVRGWNAASISFSGLSHRYWKLVSAAFIPLVLAGVYFAANHALGRAFDQFYSFNRDVYSKYTGGFGQNAVAPFIFSFRNLFSTVTDGFNGLMNSKATTTMVLQLFILVSALSVTVCMARKKQLLKAALLFAVLCGTGVRGYLSFHGLAAWYVAVMIIVLFYDELIDSVFKIAAPALVVICAYSLSIYAHDIGENLLQRQQAVSDFDNYVISITEDQDSLLVDSLSFNSIYYLYKNRNIVNRAQYILPWYMDWYEQDTIDDLLKYKPSYVLFNDDQKVWSDYHHFSNGFLNTLQQNYTRLADKKTDGGKCYIWKKNKAE